MRSSPVPPTTVSPGVGVGVQRPVEPVVDDRDRDEHDGGEEEPADEEGEQSVHCRGAARRVGYSSPSSRSVSSASLNAALPAGMPA